MKYFVRQNFPKECGFVCLKVLLSNLHNDENYLFLPSPEINEDYSFYDLIKEGEKYNLILQGYAIDTLEEITLPCIALITLDSSDHYVVVYNCNKKYLWIFDPGLGRAKISKPKFQSLSKNCYLLVKSYNRTKIKSKFFDNQKYYHLLQIINAFLQIFFLFLISFQIRNINVLFFVNVILFIASIIFNQIIHSIFMRKFDREIIYPFLKLIDNISYQQAHKYIENEYELKKSLFMQNISSLNIFLYIGFIFLILLINDYWNFISVIFISICIVFKCWFTYCHQRKFFSKIESLEQSEKNYSINYRIADELSYRYAFLVQIIDAISIAVIAAINIAICYFRGYIHLFIYYFFLEKILYENMYNAYNLKDKKDLIRKRIAYHLTISHYYKNK